eukprot:354181-Chlamydomonas_euryale.AAC.5
MSQSTVRPSAATPSRACRSALWGGTLTLRWAGRRRRVWAGRMWQRGGRWSAVWGISLKSRWDDGLRWAWTGKNVADGGVGALCGELA